MKRGGGVMYETRGRKGSGVKSKLEEFKKNKGKMRRDIKNAAEGRKEFEKKEKLTRNTKRRTL